MTDLVTDAMAETAARNLAAALIAWADAMTDPTDDAEPGHDTTLDAMVETAARARWISKVLDPRSGATREWCERAWDDMGGSEPSAERANEEICMRAALNAAAPLIAAQALRDAADAYASGRLTGAFLSRDDYARAWLRARAARIEKEARDDA